MADDGSHLSSSQLTSSSSSSSLSNAKLCSQTYKSASQLFLTRRLQEALAVLTPIITVPTVQDDVSLNESDDKTALAPIVTASSTVRIKVWNLYITLLSNIVSLDPDEGKREFGQKEWKALVSKVRDGSVWEEIVQIGYRGLEGSVDADVVFNLATLLLTHSPSQTVNQQRLETYLSMCGQPDLDVANHLQNSPSGSRRRLQRNGGTDTPKDLTSRVRIIELFTLHVLPRNGEWDYASEFIRQSEVLDEERKEGLLQTLEELKEEKERGEQRAAELQRQKEAELERQMQEEERRRAEAAQQEQAAHKRSSSEVDYGIERSLPNGVTKSPNRSSKSAEKVNGVRAGPSSGKSALSSASATSSSKKIKKTEKPSPRVSRQARALYNLIRNILQSVRNTITEHPLTFLRTLLFMVAIILALGRQDVRRRLRRLTNTGWQKVRGTVGMGMKVSYI
ncbi:hypothetical protein VTN49DRAFT_1305 [Thermomyces lanuginosus]|uniref:uncharacterized protein n=1 Tax=Thermomyces lanuginosus TaxID=5541 RepID=UPI003743D29D